MTKKLGTFLLVGLLCFVFFTGMASAEVGIDWDKGVIMATGYGAMPSKTLSVSQGNALARRAAVVDAYRNLAEIMQGVQVDAETTVENLVVQSDLVKTRVNALVKGARIVQEKQKADGSYIVVMQVNLYGGEQSLGKVIYEAQIKQQPVQKALPEVSPEYQVTTSATYTGLVVDATGLALVRCMSPKIFDETGREIYGTMYVDPEYLSEVGIIGYASTPEMLQKLERGTTRVGNKPLVVKAIKVENHGYNLVISKADGDAIFAANQRNGFLGKCSVMIKKGA